jgi:hypothetical protein
LIFCRAHEPYQDAKPSWVRLLALEVVHEFFCGPGLAYRMQRIFMLCRSYDEWDEAASKDGNVIVTLIAIAEGLAVKLLDLPGADAGTAAHNILISEKLVPAKGEKDLPLVTLRRSLLLAPSYGEDGGRWVRGLESLKAGELGLLGAGPDGVLTASEMKKNKDARALLVEHVRAELAVACGVLVMEVSVVYNF